MALLYYTLCTGSMRHLSTYISVCVGVCVLLEAQQQCWHVSSVRMLAHTGGVCGAEQCAHTAACVLWVLEAAFKTDTQYLVLACVGICFPSRHHLLPLVLCSVQLS